MIHCSYVYIKLALRATQAAIRAFSMKSTKKGMQIKMTDVIKSLYEVVSNRKQCPEEGSYTCYLFEKGLDKILKKCGEEASEMIIAAKNKDNDELSNEICDLLYHMLVLMVESGVGIDDVTAILEQRREKIGNLKQFHVTDHLS